MKNEFDLMNNIFAAPNRPHRTAYSQPDTYDYDETQSYRPHRHHRPRHYYDDEDYPEPAIKPHAHREHKHSFNEIPEPVPMIELIPSFGRHRRIPPTPPPPPYPYDTDHAYRRVRRKPSTPNFIYGIRTTESLIDNDDW